MPSRRRPRKHKPPGGKREAELSDEIYDPDNVVGRRKLRKDIHDESEVPVKAVQIATLRPNPVFAAPINDPGLEAIGSVDGVTYRVEGDDIVINLELLPGPKFTTVVEVELSMKAITDAFNTEDGSIFYPCFPAYSFSVFSKELFEILEAAGITETFESLKN